MRVYYNNSIELLNRWVVSFLFPDVIALLYFVSDGLGRGVCFVFIFPLGMWCLSACRMSSVSILLAM